MSPEHSQWRLFVAVPTGEALRAALAESVARWRDRPDLAGLRWTDAAGWHITLAFLGATEPRSVPSLVAALRDVGARHAPVTLRAGGTGAFPSRSRARVAWYGLEDRDGRLRALARDVAAASGLDDADRFRAHVTLARARAEPLDLRAWVESAEAPSGEVAVDRIELMRSHLGRGPARYEIVESIPLGEPMHV